MKKTVEKVVIPTLKFNSDYFKCPKCGWTTSGPRLVSGDIAHTPCESCGHSYLMRIK